MVIASRILLLLAVATAALSAALAAGDTDPRETELAEIREQIGRLESRLTEMRSRETSLEDRLDSLRLEIKLQEVQLTEATAAFELAEARTAAAEAEIGRLEAALVKIRQDLERRLAGLYRLGRQGYLRLFLSLEPNQDLLPAIRQLRFLVRRDQFTLERYTVTRDRLEEQRETLATERQEMAVWRGQEQKRRDQLVANRRRQQRMLNRVTRERRELLARTQALQDKERKLARLIDSLLESGAKPLEGTPIQAFRGALDWPIRGEVTATFGPRLDPRYRTEVPHNGIDVTAPAGAEIRSIYPGEVLYASEFEGYGPMVVLHHSGRVFTLYAGLSELRAEKGQSVPLGTVLGTATGVLYFEIRVENQPEDPVGWLR